MTCGSLQRCSGILRMLLCLELASQKPVFCPHRLRIKRSTRCGDPWTLERVNASPSGCLTGPRPRDCTSVTEATERQNRRTVPLIGLLSSSGPVPKAWSEGGSRQKRGLEKGEGGGVRSMARPAAPTDGSLGYKLAYSPSWTARTRVRVPWRSSDPSRAFDRRLILWDLRFDAPSVRNGQGEAKPGCATQVRRDCSRVLGFGVARLLSQPPSTPTPIALVRDPRDLRGPGETCDRALIAVNAMCMRRSFRDRDVAPRFLSLGCTPYATPSFSPSSRFRGLCLAPRWHDSHSTATVDGGQRLLLCKPGLHSLLLLSSRPLLGSPRFALSRPSRPSRPSLSLLYAPSVYLLRSFVLRTAPSAPHRARRLVSGFLTRTLQ